MASFARAASAPATAQIRSAGRSLRNTASASAPVGCSVLSKKSSNKGASAHPARARQQVNLTASETLQGQPLVARRRPASAAAQRTGVSVTVADASGLTVAVTGATGFVGAALVDELSKQGATVKVLARDQGAAQRKFAGKKGVEVVASYNWGGALKGCTAIVNLAGEPISTRWTPQIKADIMASRVNTTKKLASAVNALSEADRPKVLVSASAVGFYGTSETECYDEKSPAGDDYLAKVCVNWEAEAAKVAVERCVVLRLGIVLENGGGALAKMLPIFQLGAGGPLGNGQQFFSWIHRDDVMGMIMEAINNSSWIGAYNATGPKPVRMGEMCTALGDAVSRPSWLPVPKFALQAILGEGATVVLEGQQVLPTRALEEGYKFKYGTVGAAVSAITKGQ